MQIWTRIDISKRLHVSLNFSETMFSTIFEYDDEYVYDNLAR